MKRTLALVLALIMILCMVPASMLTAFARGRGVYANNISNQTIENAPGQFIPETVVVDGVMDDTAWKEDDWKRVNSDSGTWSVQYPVTKNETFAYKYNVKKDYYYLYGAFVVPTSETGLVKLWLNNDAEAANRYTHVFTFDITGQMSGDKASSGNGTWIRETSTGIKVTDKSSYYYEKSKVVFVQDGDYTNIEFKVLLADFCAAPNPSIDYFAEVEASNDESLWHPMIEIDETFERSEWFPSMSGNWKSDFAGKITSADLNGIGEHSFLGAIDINGEFDEAEWAQHTDFYSRWYERTNVVDYKDNVNFMKPYSDLVYNKSFWNATSNSSAEHDVRVSKNYIHGAAVISVPAATTTNNIRFNMFHKLDNGDIWQATVYLHSTAGNTIDAAQFTFYVNGANPLTYVADMSTSEYVYSSATDSAGTPIFQAGTKVIGSPGMYSFEFKISRAFGPDFAPTVYDFCMAPNDSARYWSCDNRYDGTAMSDYVGDHPIQHHPNYTEDAANLKQDYYPITHYNNQFGLDDIGATDAEPEYYEPYTLYTTDGYLGVKAWPGLTFSAGGPCNSDFVNSANSTRLKNLNYLHSLRADYEFVYGALSIQAEADSPFKNWIHGTETSPAGGDYFTLWVMVPDETGTLYRFDIWTYLDGNEVKAQIAGVDENGDYVIEPESGAKAAFVNRENDPNKDRYYALEYQIALSSVNKKLDTSIDVTEQVADYLSTPIFEYYTSLSVANDEKNAYGSMIWPKSGNGNLMPNESGFYWNKEADSNGIYGNPQVLRYQDVIRVVEPDGRIVEELRFDLDDINFTDSEYRDISKYGNFFTAKEEFYVGRDYAYLGAEIDGNLSSYNTKVTLWIKKKDGTIHNYEFGHNGANTTLKYDGIPVSGTTYVDQYGMTSTNGRTYFEAVIDMDRFGADDGFEYYIEITQRINGENISRVFSDGTKIILPAIDFASQLNGVKAWYQTAGHVEDLVHFPREEITVDGNLNDNGWDPGEWKYVSTDINANLQEADTHKDAFKTDFYYQLRVDDEYLYVAAVIFYSDCTLAANTANIQASQPSFRIWVKSGENGKNSQAGNSETYTDYYGMSMDKNGNLKFGSAKNVLPTYANNTRQLYNKYYVPVVPAKDANGNYITENGKIKYTYDAKGMDTIYHRSATDTKYPSHLFGYTQYIVNEQEANKNANESVVLKGETINPEDYDKEGMLDHSKTQYDVERGIMRFGSDTKYNQQFNHGRVETLGGDSMVVEFKVKLDEFGGKDQFQYLVTTSAVNSWGGTRTTMHPAITSESGSRDNYFHYYYPYWHWADDTAVTVTDEVRADMTLLTYKRPVITLGAKVSKTYMYQGKETNALRMGGLWEEKYIRETKELVANNGYWPDKNGKPNWVDYWDVKAMGMVVIPTYLLKQNTKINADRPGIYDLFKGTTNSVWMDADGIVGWAGNDETKYPKNNYADYKNFAFYVTVVNVPANVNFCFRGFVDYYDEVLDKCPSYYDVILERSIDMVIDSAIRTDSDESDEEDNALPGGGYSRDDESGWTGTDGSDYENSIDPSEDVSDEVSDDVVAPGITVEKDGASLDIAWPTNYNGTATGKYPNSLVFADNTEGNSYAVGGFYYDSASGNKFPGDALQWWTKMYFTQNADGTLTLQNIELPGGTDYQNWKVTSDVLVVSYYDDHPNKAVFDDYKVGETFIIEGMTLDAIGGTGNDAELTATLKRVILCNHTSGWNPATCTSPATCKDCGAPKADSYPLGHNYDENDVQDCLTGINCTVCGYEKVAALGHTNGLGKWTYDSEAHWWTCTREGCPEADVKRNEAVHTFKNGKCSVCGYACEHPYGEGNFYEAVEPTCGVSGNIAYYECECGLKFTDANCTTPLTDVILPALEHEYDEETGICKNCGDELTATIVGQLEHAYPGKYYSDGTAQGYYTQVYADSTKAPHSLRGFAKLTGEYTANSEWFPMPSDAGGGDLAWWRKISFRKISGVDGKEYFVAQAICEPAQNVDGVVVYGDLSYLDDLTSLSAEEKANHPWYIDEDVMVVAVAFHDTYTEAFFSLQLGDVVYISGEGAYTFAQLGNTDEDTLLTDANGNFNTFLTLHRHKWTAATCETPRMCKECGEVDTSSSAYGHTPGAEATCTTAQICTTCKATLVPALGHDFSSYVSNNNATCIANGTETATCGRGCGATDTREVADSKLGHSFVNYVSNNNATCTANGTESATCERGCGARDTRVVENSALGHSFTKYVFDNNATCNANGTETAECDNKCGASDTREVANSKFDHSFTNYIYNNDATCTEDGTETAKCDYYGCTATDTRPKANTALGHDPVSEWTSDATHHWHECSRGCADYKGSLEEHNFVDGFCSVCEKAQFNPIKLDIAWPNGDPGNQTIVFCSTEDLGDFQLKGFWENDYDSTDIYPDTGDLAGWRILLLDRVDGLYYGDGKWEVVAVDATGTLYAEDTTTWKIGLLETGEYRMAIAVPPAKIDDSLLMIKEGDLVNWVTPADGTDYDAVADADVNMPVNAYLDLDCIHVWNDATCDAPMTCKLCGLERDPALGHAWNDATCTAPKTCDRCGETEGEALGHVWVDATCTTPKTCDRCGEIGGIALGHAYESTFTYDDLTHWHACSRCGEKSDVALHTYIGYSDKCSECGFEKDHVHTLGEKVAEKSANCTTAGMKEYYVCLGCGNWFADANATVLYEGKENDSDIIIPALGHTAGAAATCTTAQTCTECGEVLVAALGHTAGAEATCTTAQTCIRCEYVFAAALGHEMKTVWSNDNTAHWHECTRCDHIEDYAEHNYPANSDKCDDCGFIKNHTHTLGEHVDGYDATCTTAGQLEYWICAGISCDAKLDKDGNVLETVVIDALGHAWNDATCTAPKTCGTCGATEGEALGHKPGAAPTCTEDQICTVCYVVLNEKLGHVAGSAATCTTPQICTVCKIELVAPLGHTAGAAATCTTAQTCTVCSVVLVNALGHKAGVAATCTTAQTCTVCGEVLANALGHSFTNYKSNNDATCLEDGTKTAKCDRCDVTETVVDNGSALGHNMAPATCLEASKCTRCDYTEGEALGHSFTNYKSNNDATCLEDGTKTAKCDRCDATNTVVDAGSALDHDWIAATCTAPKTCDRCDVTEGDPIDHVFNDYVSDNNASCETDGTKTAACIYGCGETDTVVDNGSALEHVFENYEIVVKPTCTDTGLKTATCSNGCGATETVVVEALGHTKGEAATCTTDQICTVCGYVFVEALGHNYVDQGDNTEKCTNCGDVQVLFTPVEIPLSHAGNDSYNSDYSWGVFVLAGSSYTAVSVTSPDWCQAALLEYDDVLGMFRVVEKSAPTNGAATTYKSWYYGSDRIIIYANGANSGCANAIAGLKVDDYLELSGITFDTLKSRGDSSYAYMSETITLTTVNYHGVGDATAPQVLTPIIKEPKYNNFTVAYIPLDDRPVHTDRVALTAEAAGITLLMPNAEDYMTHLYNASLGEEGHGGDPVKLLAWLKEQEANGVDYYVIALDQIFSGGLVNSRYSDASFNGQFTAQDKEIADFLVELAKNNYVVYTDTIMRLASTYPYKDHTEVLYTMLRDYGQGKNYYGTSNRIVLDENGTDKYNLTFEHVVSSYKFSKDGTTPIGRYYQVSGSFYNLEDNILNGYLGARERKLRITDYMLRNAGGNINHYYIGMDDSAEGETIQKNEQRYIDMIIEQTGSNAITFAGADEMSVMGISAMTNLLADTSENEQIPAANGWEISKVPVNVVYFGEEAKNWQADEYDSGKLGPAIDLHLKGLDAYQVADAYKLDKRVIQLVVVARGTEQYSFSSDGSAAQTQIALSRQNAANAADYIDAQLENNRPVAIIDVSYWNASHLNFVVEAMRNRGIFNRADFNEILGYSTWNTAGNAIGLGMGQAFARYNYIMNTDVVSRSSNLGFLKLLAYSFVKDSAYRTNSFIYWSMDTSSAKTYTCGTYSYTTAGFTGNEFLGYINNSTKMLLKGGVSGDYAYNHNVSIHSPVWPANWGPRSFECWFTVEATSDEPETGDKFAGGGVVLPDEDFE